ncbi:Septum formation [Sanguibacter gelidistatuariae]|uniref:Septum formation n=1 Tax=Sanguibacter gelidistatuariae TaxID=1814289 RepID=A0A1G6MVM7_9MICO|nr:septum formation family protein [Sanguibacter gelidistatuariae]SDC59589.1 Septum formation [Sanguibacter gelidistatuariae]
MTLFHPASRPARGAILLAAATLLLTAGCSGSDDDATKVSIFDLEVGDCVRAADEVSAEVETVERVGCETGHELELYSEVAFTTGTGEAGAFPGDAALVTFADGMCAEGFEDYVGVDYRDSALYFTYLLPSARGWDQGPDTSVLCFVTTTGEQLTASVRGTAT